MKKTYFLLCILLAALVCGCTQKPSAEEAPNTQTVPAAAQWHPASFLSTITAGDRRCSAEFPPNIQQQYIFSKEQDAQLISLLNRLQPEEFLPGAANGVKAAVTISHGESPLWLYYDGQMVQFSFVFDNSHWVVCNEELNAYMEELLKYSPANSTYEVYNVAPLNELPDTYSQEEASIDKVVILNEGDVRENAEVWEEFLKSTNARIPVTVRIMKYYSAADGLAPVKDLYDLEFDGNSYHLHYVENGKIQSVHYHHLWNLSGQSAPLPSGAFHEYALMCLSNEELYETPMNLRENDRFAKPGDDPFMVWCDYTVRQKNLSVPDSSKITLEVDLTPYVTITDPAIIYTIETIFADAEAYFTPKTYFPGPVLRFHSSDGVDLTLQLDLEDDLCIFNGQFYHYGKPDTSMLQGLWKLMGLKTWPEEIVKHPAFSFYFQNIR